MHGGFTPFLHAAGQLLEEFTGDRPRIPVQAVLHRANGGTRQPARDTDAMDLLYVSILIAFFALVCGLAVGCSHLQNRRAGLRQRNGADARASAPL